MSLIRRCARKDRYPFERQDVAYDIPHITARVTAVGGSYDGPSHSPWVHRLRMERTQTFDPDGMSGGPVFYVGGGANTFFMGFAGVVIRGGANSEILHFVEAGSGQSLEGAFIV